MSIYDLDLLSKVIEWLPPNKRGVVMGKWVQTLVSQVQYLVFKMLYDWRTGSTYPNWIPGTYNAGVRVVYKFKIYECVTNGTTTTPPGAGWQLYLDNFIGADERKLFNGQKVVLEYALNSYYQTQFRQPPLVSDIYITNSTQSTQGFVVGESVGSFVTNVDTAAAANWNPYATYSVGQIVKYNNYLYTSKMNSNTASPLDTNNWIKQDTVAPLLPFGYAYNFSINVPSAIYNSVSPSVSFEMSGIVNNYVPASITYIITPY